MGNIVLPTVIMPVCEMAKRFRVPYVKNCPTKLKKDSKAQRVANIFVQKDAKPCGVTNCILVLHTRISRQENLCIEASSRDLGFRKYASCVRLRITGFWRYIISTRTGRTTCWRISCGFVIIATFSCIITMRNTRNSYVA